MDQNIGSAFGMKNLSQFTLIPLFLAPYKLPLKNFNKMIAYQNWHYLLFKFYWFQLCSQNSKNNRLASTWGKFFHHNLNYPLTEYLPFIFTFLSSYPVYFLKNRGHLETSIKIKLKSGQLLHLRFPSSQ